MQRVHEAALDRPSGRDQGLARHLAAEDPLAVLLRAAPAEDVHLELLEVEELDQVVERCVHAVSTVKQSGTAVASAGDARQASSVRSRRKLDAHQ